MAKKIQLTLDDLKDPFWLKRGGGYIWIQKKNDPLPMPMVDRITNKPLAT